MCGTIKRAGETQIHRLTAAGGVWWVGEGECAFWGRSVGVGKVDATAWGREAVPERVIEGFWAAFGHTEAVDFGSVASSVGGFWGESCPERRGCQSVYPALRTHEQAMGWAPSRETDDEPPCLSDHSPRNADDAEAHGLHTLAHPLFAQHQLLHRRVQIERQHHYRPPRRVRPELPRRQPALRKVLLQHRMHLLTPSTGSGQALATPLPVPPDQLIPRQLSVRHHPCHFVPFAISHLHDGNRQLLPIHVEQRRVRHTLPYRDEPVVGTVLAVPRSTGPPHASRWSAAGTPRAFCSSSTPAACASQSARRWPPV